MIISLPLFKVTFFICLCFKMVSIRGQKAWATPRLVSFRGLIQNFRRASPLLSYESPPGHSCQSLEIICQNVFFIVCHVKKYSTILGVFWQPSAGFLRPIRHFYLSEVKTVNIDKSLSLCLLNGSSNNEFRSSEFRSSAGKQTAHRTY